MELLMTLMRLPVLGQMRLVGGTALALQYVGIAALLTSISLGTKRIKAYMRRRLVTKTGVLSNMQKKYVFSFHISLVFRTFARKILDLDCKRSYFKNEHTILSPLYR